MLTQICYINFIQTFVDHINFSLRKISIISRVQKTRLHLPTSRKRINTYVCILINLKAIKTISFRVVIHNSHDYLNWYFTRQQFYTIGEWLSFCMISWVSGIIFLLSSFTFIECDPEFIWVRLVKGLSWTDNLFFLVKVTIWPFEKYSWDLGSRDLAIVQFTKDKFGIFTFSKKLSSR